MCTCHVRCLQAWVMLPALIDIACSKHTSLGRWCLVLLTLMSPSWRTHTINYVSMFWIMLHVVVRRRSQIWTNNVKCVKTLADDVLFFCQHYLDCMHDTINDSHLMHTLHGWLAQFLDDVLCHSWMFPGRCMQAINDVTEWIRRSRDLCIQYLVYITVLRETSLTIDTHSRFVCVGLRECCLSLADIYIPICVGNAWC